MCHSTSCFCQWGQKRTYSNVVKALFYILSQRGVLQCISSCRICTIVTYVHTMRQAVFMCSFLRACVHKHEHTHTRARSIGSRSSNSCCICCTPCSWRRTGRCGSRRPGAVAGSARNTVGIHRGTSHANPFLYRRKVSSRLLPCKRPRSIL